MPLREPVNEVVEFYSKEKSKPLKLESNSWVILPRWWEELQLKLKLISKAYAFFFLRFVGFFQPNIWFSNYYKSPCLGNLKIHVLYTVKDFPPIFCPHSQVFTKNSHRSPLLLISYISGEFFVPLSANPNIYLYFPTFLTQNATYQTHRFLPYKAVLFNKFVLAWFPWGTDCDETDVSKQGFYRGNTGRGKGKEPVKADPMQTG